MAEVRMTKNRWKALAAETTARVDDVTETFAGVIEGAAAADAPYQYGHLQASHGVTTLGIAMRQITVGQFYGLFQHEGYTMFGWSEGAVHVAGRPWLRDQVQRYSAPYVQAVGLAVSGGW